MRCKCANCGMIYEDVDYIPGLVIGDYPKLDCPKCGSNAKDYAGPSSIMTTTVEKEYSTVKF